MTQAPTRTYKVGGRNRPVGGSKEPAINYYDGIDIQI